MKSIIISLLCGSAMLLHGENPVENLIVNGGAEDAAQVAKWGGGLGTSKVAKSGNYAFQAVGPNVYAKSSVIEIDPNGKYVLSGFFKSLTGKGEKLYFGLILLDAEGKELKRIAVDARNNTDAALLKDANFGDKTILIDNGVNWIQPTTGGTTAVFNSKIDFSDLPNNNFASKIIKIEKKESGYEITFQQGLMADYPAGTLVRQHDWQGGYMYCAAAYAEAPKDWKKFECVIDGTAKAGATNNQFWPGSKKVKALVMANFGAKAADNPVILFDDLELKPSK